MLARIGIGLVTFVVGAATGLASVALHQKAVPWLVLAVAAPLSATVALSPGWPRVGFGLGWVALVMMAVRTRPEGDYVISATVSGYVLLGSALLLMVLAVATVPVRRAESGSGASAT